MCAHEEISMYNMSIVQVIFLIGLDPYYSYVQNILLLSMSKLIIFVTDPCKTHGILSDFFRTTATVTYEHSHCDTNLKEGWYRLKLGNKDANLITYAPDSCRCGTRGSIWWKG